MRFETSNAQGKVPSSKAQEKTASSKIQEKAPPSSAVLRLPFPKKGGIHVGAVVWKRVLILSAIWKRVLILSVGWLFATFVFGCERQAVLQGAPRPRIVSFSPAITDMLFAMGLGEHIVGVTQFCHLPKGEHRPNIGSVMSINSQVILSVQPDIIFTQVDASRFKGVRDIRPQVKVEYLRLERLHDIPRIIEQIGDVVGRPELAKQLNRRYTAKMATLRRRMAGALRPKVLFVMGTDRPTVAGDGNFIHDLIEMVGGQNVGTEIPGKGRWRRTHIDAIAKLKPDVIICHKWSQGKDEEARNYWLQWRELPAAQSGRVYVVMEPAWTIPSPKITAIAEKLVAMVHQKKIWKDHASDFTGMSLWLAWLYRLLAAAIVGAGLGASGMALQGLLRNPLAEPYVLGISSGAGVGVLLGMALAGWIALPIWFSTPVLAFVGAMLTCAVVYSIAQRRGRLDPYSLILSGVIVNSFNAAIMLTVYLYIDPHRIADFSHWSIGRLPDAIGLSLLLVSGVCVLLGWLVLLVSAHAYNVLTLGDEVASATGVSVHRLRLITFLSVGAMTAACVALAGPIGFLGLIVPHICRMFIGPDHRVGIAVSGIVGALLLMGAESFCRVAGPWIGVSLIPVGILTALSGGPFFIYLLRRRFGETPP